MNNVIYHSLQGAETCDRYLDDARRADTDELAQFSENCREERNQRALDDRLLAEEVIDLEEEAEGTLEREDAVRSALGAASRGGRE
jgi:hypothetical protein